MASVYKGLVIQVGADTSKLDSALAKARRSVAGVSAEMRKLESSLKMDPGSTTLMARQQELYQKQIRATNDELRALRSAEEQVGRENMSTDQWTKLQADIDLAEKRLEEYTRQVKRLQTEQAAANTALGRAGQKLADLGDKLEPVGQKMESIGSKMTMGLTLPIVAGAGAAIKAATDLDTSLTNVKKTVDGTAEDYENLKDAAVEFSKVNAVSASELLDIEALGAQLGFTLEKFSNGKSQVQEFGEVVSGLDIATNMSAEQAGTELAQFFNIMQENKEMASNYGSAIVGLGNSFATTESDISAMAMRIAGAGKSIGLSSADVLGLSTALTSLGISAEAGGTAISTVMSDIDKAVATNGDSLETWASTANMSVDEFSRAWKEDATGALDAVLKGMAANVEEGGNLSIILEDLGIDSLRQTDMMKRLANSGDLMSRAIARANSEWSENSALSNEVANRNASMAAKFDMLKNRVADVAAEIGEPLADALFELLDAAEPLFEAIENGARAFADMSDEEQQQVVQTVALIAALGPALSLFGKIAKSVPVVSRALTGMSRALVTVRSGMASARAGMTEVNATAKDLQLYAKLSGNSMNGLSARAKAASVALKGSATAAKAARVSLAALGTVGVMVAVTAIVELVNWLGQLAEHNEQVSKATDGLNDAIGTLGQKSTDGARGIDGLSGSVADYRDHVDSAIEKQAELAESIAEDFGEVNQKAGALDYWAQKIAELSGNVGDSPEKLAELRVAIEQYNSIAGTSYSITDETTGALDVSTDALLRNAEAWELNATKQAMAEKTTELVKQQIDNEMALEDATRAYEEAAAAAQKEQDGLGYVTQVTAQKMGEAEKAMNEAQAAVDANAKAQERLAEKTTETQKQLDALSRVSAAAAESGSEAVQKFAEGLDAGQASAMESAAGVAGATVGELLAAAADAGLAGKEQVDSYIAAVNEGKSPAEAAAQAIADTANVALEQNADGTDAGAKESETFADGIDPRHPMSMALKMALKSVEEAKNAADATTAGAKLSSTAAGGIRLTAMNDNSAQMLKNAIAAAKGVDTRDIGRYFSEGAAAGISSDAFVKKSVEMVIAGVKAANDAAQIKSPSRVMMRMGRYFAEGAAIGIEDETPEVERAAKEMADAAANAAKMASPNLAGSYSSTASARQMARAMAEEGTGGMTVMFNGAVVNDTPAIQDAVLTIVSAAQVSAQARRHV